MFKLIFRLTVPAAMMTVAAAPVTAQSFEELDALAEQTTDEERGIAAAQNVGMRVKINAVALKASTSPSCSTWLNGAEAKIST